MREAVEERVNAGHVLPPAERYAETIRGNAGKFPMLNTYMRFGEVQPDRGRAYWEFAKRLKHPAAIAVATMAAAYAASKGLHLTQGAMTRRKFLQTAAIGTGLVFTGSLADVATTRDGLIQYESGLKDIRASPEFQRLPEEIRARILPPVEWIELNPRLAGSIGQQMSPKVAARRAVEQTAVVSAGMGIFATLTRLLYRGSLKGGKTIGRRAFLGASAASASMFGYAGVSNVRTMRYLEEHPRLVIAELGELHKMMERRD